MKKIVSIFLIVVLAVLLLIGLKSCGNSIKDEAIDQGKLSLAKSEYKNALSSFELAIKEGSKDEEVKTLIIIIKDFNKSKRFIEEGNFNQAKKILDEIDSTYKNYAIKDDIDKLKSEVVEYEKHNESMNNEIKSIEQLISENNYGDAKVKSEELLSDKTLITNIQEEEINGKIVIINGELERIENERIENERVRVEKEKSTKNAANGEAKKKEETNKKTEVTSTTISREQAIKILLDSDKVTPPFINVSDSNFDINKDGVLHYGIELHLAGDSELFLVNSQNGSITNGDYLYY